MYIYIKTLKDDLKTYQSNLIHIYFLAVNEPLSRFLYALYISIFTFKTVAQKCTRSSLTMSI